MMLWEWEVCHDALGVQGLPQCSGSGRFATVLWEYKVCYNALGVEGLL